MGIGKDILASLLAGAGGMSEGYADQKSGKDKLMDQLVQLYAAQSLQSNDPYRQQLMKESAARTEKMGRPDRPTKHESTLSYLGDREASLRELLSGKVKRAKEDISSYEEQAPGLESQASSLEELLSRNQALQQPPEPSAEQFDPYSALLSKEEPENQSTKNWLPMQSKAAGSIASEGSSRLAALLKKREAAQLGLTSLEESGGEEQLIQDQMQPAYEKAYGIEPTATDLDPTLKEDNKTALAKSKLLTDMIKAYRKESGSNDRPPQEEIQFMMEAIDIYLKEAPEAGQPLDEDTVQQGMAMYPDKTREEIEAALRAQGM